MGLGSEAIVAVASRKATSLRAIVQGEIERMILDGQLAAGQRINEQQLAAQLGVSRGPVREALRSLERAGLVLGVANLGMFVRQFSAAEAIELYELRGLVFGFACMRVAGNLTAKQQATLRQSVRQMDEAISCEDDRSYYRLNLQFHDLIMAYAGHRRAIHVYDALVKEGHLVRTRALRPVTSMRNSNDEHKAIVEAIITGDVAGARAMAESHHVHGKERWLDSLM